MRILKGLALIFVGTFIAVAILSATSNSSYSTRPSQQVVRSVVFNSGWDGSVFQAEQYLKRRLKDPDSYEDVAWGEVTKTDEGFYVTWVEYIATNSFGARTRGKAAFLLSEDGEVLHMEELGL